MTGWLLMPAEYMNHRFPSDASDTSVETVLNELAQGGWTVKAAYSPTHFLLERLPPPMVARAEPKPPTGPGGRGQ